MIPLIHVNVITITVFAGLFLWILGREYGIQRLKKEKDTLEKALMKNEQRTEQIQQENNYLRETNLHVQTALKENASLLVSTRKDLESQFQSVCNQAFIHTQKSLMSSLEPMISKFQDTTTHTLKEQSGMLQSVFSPLMQGLVDMQDHIKVLEKNRLGSHEMLKEQIIQLAQGQRLLHSETNALTTALRAPHVRGCWGEMQLKRVVELAGMVPYCDFQEQASMSDYGPSEKKGKVKPDMLIHLPGQKVIMVDAKTPLMHYLEGLASKNTQEYGQKMKAHAKMVAAHIKALSEKKYWTYMPNSVEFTLLFLPGEAFLSAALESDPTLIEIAAEKNIILATPVILIALLKTIAFGWRQEVFSQQTQRIIDLSRHLYTRLGVFHTSMKKLSSSLKSSQAAYQEASCILEDSILPTADYFQKLSTSNENPNDTLKPSRASFSDINDQPPDHPQEHEHPEDTSCEA